MNTLQIVSETLVKDSSVSPYCLLTWLFVTIFIGSPQVW